MADPRAPRTPDMSVERGGTGASEDPAGSKGAGDPPGTDEAVEVEQAVEAMVVSTDFVDCYQHHFRSVVRALRLAGADPASAEDMAQEAFARALPHWRRVQRGANPAGYVYRSAFRLQQRAQRRRKRPEHLAAPLPVGLTDQDATTTVSVQGALAAMPARRRQCAILCLVLGFPPADAGAALGIAAGTVRKHLDEARRELRAACEAS